MPEWTRPRPGQLIRSWKAQVVQYEQQIAEAKRVGTPYQQMVGCLSQLRNCIVDLELERRREPPEAVMGTVKSLLPDRNVRVPPFVYLSEGCDPAMADKLNEQQRQKARDESG